MKFIIPEKEGKCDNLQHQEEQEVEVPSDEEKYISHLQVDFKYLLFQKTPINALQRDSDRNV
jgi:hypothetical protein